MLHHTFFFPFGGLLWIILIAILVAHLWRGKDGYRHHGPGHHHHPHSGHAEDILAERFARGEITEAEYNERLGVLKKNYK